MPVEKFYPSGDMWRAAILVLCGFLLACQQQNASVDTGLEGYDPHQVDIQRAACVKHGGRFGAGGLSGSYVCYEPTRDANKRCSSASDCDGMCLARSRTCTPVKPLFGCNEVLTISGRVTKVCIN